ncbi:serine/threonine protein kinase [Pendulispora rubella]|uniref:Serine/threonine protein kinase n=1 Tax=Pendulispora rubella TaxID=2741070 RepID=A0ABZ2L9D7_9BACT
MAEESGRVLGRYTLHGTIAVGGMATVHFGRLHGPIGFSRTVAIKRLHPHYARDPEFVAMFLDEARLTARIWHPNVVPTLDVVSTEGELFVVMEFVHGESLSRLIKAEGAKARRIPPSVVVAILSGTLQGLHAAHEACNEQGQPLSLVHRDVSPQNVLVGVDGVARVLDFGIAKATGRLRTTQHGELKGKLAYMAPEQLLGEETTRQVDIYAASVCLWEALTGRRLFSGNNEGDVLNQVLLGDIPPPGEYVPGLGRAVDDVVLCGLSRDPCNRFRTALEMAIALDEAMDRVASPPQVSAWLRGVVGAEMDERRRTVVEIERQTSQPSPEEALREILPPPESMPPEEPIPSSTGGSVTSTRPAEMKAFDAAFWWRTAISISQRNFKTRKAFLALAAWLVFVVTLLVLVVTTWQRPSGRAATKGEPSHPIFNDPREAPVFAPAPAESAQAPAPPTMASAPASASASQLFVDEVVAAMPGPSEILKTSPVVPAAKKSCDPPYYIDKAGRKRFRRECF